MPHSREDDLDWLYDRGSKHAEPEPTRVLSAPPAVVPERPPLPPGYPATPSYPSVPGYGQAGRGPQPGRPPGPPPPPDGPPETPATRPARRRRPVRNTLRALALLLVLALAWLFGVPAYAWQQVSHVDDAPSGQRPADQPGTTFLLVGSDSREGLTKAQRKKLGTGSVAGQRTDTIMLVSVPPGGKPALVSLPRDSYVDVPGHGKDKINAAFAYDGPKLLEQTIEQNTGLRIDGYLEIGLGGFADVIDALGGIRMCLPKAIRDQDSHLDLPKGCQVLDGTNALGYVRMRKADPLGDLGRVQRQRAMLAAVAAKAASPATVANPVRYWRLNHAAAESVVLGEDTSFTQVASLALAMRKIAGGDGLTLTVPVSDPGASTPVGSAVLWDQTKAADLFGDLARGDTSDLKKYAG
ncbi:LCP family protein [uncultured Friedmanniella sp.]|uniref:LCP family protein n=1 Tax=uncultured Friedmanniella sp. TaxID=335381 RepID=UPI0035CC2279